MEEKKKRSDTSKMLTIEFSLDLHREIKKRAAERNVTIRRYVTQAILSRIATEKQYE